MTNTQIMNEISMTPAVRKKWRPLSRDRKIEVLRIVAGCADKECLLAAIKMVKKRGKQKHNERTI